MIDRRTALKLSVTGILSGIVNLPSSLIAKPSKKDLTLPVYAIYDSAITESLNFASTLNNSNFQTSDIKGDLGKLWYEQLRNQLITERKAIIGLTNRLDLFCLEELARDVGMKVSFRIDHLIHQDGLVEHQLNGSPFTDSSLDNLGHDSGFGKVMGELSELFIANQSHEVSIQKLTGPYAPLNKTALVTWVIS